MAIPSANYYMHSSSLYFTYDLCFIKDEGLVLAAIIRIIMAGVDAS